MKLIVILVVVVVATLYFAFRNPNKTKKFGEWVKEQKDKVKDGISK